MDSDDEELESFEVTDFDLQNEFNPNRFKRKKGGKKQAIYGVFAVESDDESEMRQGLGAGGGSRNAMEDMGFISAGVTGVKNPDDDAPTDEELEDSKEVEEEGKKEPEERLPGGKMTRAQKAHAMLMKADKNLGAWEKNTKGFGQKLLLKMGYIPGKGLGKSNQGIVRPVEATKRRGKGAIGAHGSEHPHLDVEDVVADLEEEEDRQFQEQLSQWKRAPGDAGKGKKVVYKYRTAEEVLISGVSKKSRKKESDLTISKVKVIDMTQPEQRIMGSYHEMAQQHERPSETFDGTDDQKRAFEMPELEHNLQLLVEMSEQHIIHHDRQLHHEEDLVVNLQHEKVKLEGVLKEETLRISRLKKVLEMIDRCEEKFKLNSTDPLVLDDCEIMMKRLQVDYLEEYRAFEVSQLAVVIMFPFVRRELNSWSPFEEVRKHEDLFQKWKRILDNDDNRINIPDGPTINMYERMVWELWMPCVRRAISQWSPRSSDQVQEFLENWIPLIPVWVKDNIFDQLIMPRLVKEVEDWDPLTDVVPIHSWIHPWLPLLGDKLEPVYAPIRQKFGNALTGWHPSDSSAKTILTPWKAVFSQGTMDAFILRNIVPKLAICLQEFSINPYQQHLQPFHWVMAWDEFLPTPVMVTLFEKNFFPKWIQVLISWLGNSPNFEEVSNWFSGWKSLFPTRISTEPVIKNYFSDALAIMNRAVSGHNIIKENLAYLSNLQRQRARGQERWEDKLASTPQAEVPETFRELLERKAEESGILFVPTNKREEGIQVFALGNRHIFIKKGVVFIQDHTEWKPVPLATAIEMGKGVA
ncbi:tuftelin-interacting protein 11-like [Apostichopus japonicus]|uniref:tuftelin-interacting protein 11-like n=1 Tax=Stichopus japonicus TaxID=307972 RepID=UPI003AB33A7F